MIDLTLAQAKVSLLDAAEDWYSRVFGAPPDTRPMDGLIEWRFGHAHGVQVFLDPEAAGRSAVVVGTTDLDATVARLDDAGVAHGGIGPGGGGRLVTLADPDGNQVVLLDAVAAHGGASNDVAQTTLRFHRRLDAPLARVWDAYADVGQRQDWAVPEGEQAEYATAEFAAGGVDDYRCGPPGDLSNHVITRYLRVDAPHQFVAANELRRDETTAATDTTYWRLDEANEATALTIVVQVTSLAGDGVLEGYRVGHERTLDHLEAFLRAPR